MAFFRYATTFTNPLVYAEDLLYPLDRERDVAGFDLNVEEQLRLLTKLDYGDELDKVPIDSDRKDTFHYHNGAFESGDAEYLYNMIRHFSPRRIMEIGSGYSTLMARAAIEKNISEDSDYICEHTCIEPYQMPWLESTGATILRKRVEECDLEIFDELGENDILFIDSSHIIRAQGDVLFEYLEILGRLGNGVLIHVHDIFLPRDYPADWLFKQYRFWNEQYLLEAFLAFNRDFSVIGALNYLWHNHRRELESVCPMLATEPDREPGSFWFRRN